MTPDEQRQFSEILSHGSMLNISEKFLVDLVFRLSDEIDQVILAKLNAVRDAQHRCGIEHQQKQKAIAALRTVLARIRYATLPVRDWIAPNPSRDDIDPETARHMQYSGRLEDWLEQTIAGLE